MKVRIDTIPHDQQRYPTCGDWKIEQTPKGEVLEIKVSELSDWRAEMLVALHELVEVLLCKQAGISQEAVDVFDQEYERLRKEGDLSEPGDDPKAPYYRQHQIASVIERLVAVDLGVNWENYAKEIEDMP